MTLLLALSTANAATIDVTLVPGLENPAPNCSILNSCERSVGVTTELREPGKAFESADADMDARIQELEARVQGMALQNTRQARRLKALERNALRDDRRIDELSARTDILASANDAQDSRIESIAQSIQDIAEKLAPVYDLLRFVKADVQAQAVRIVGANVFVQSGAGSTMDAGSGLGNLIVGYDESDGPDKKLGSHNLIVGPGHRYDGAGMIVAGCDNVAETESVVVAGTRNDVFAPFSAVLGGQDNTARAPWSVAPSARLTASSRRCSAETARRRTSPTTSRTEAPTYPTRPPHRASARGEVVVVGRCRACPRWVTAPCSSGPDDPDFGSDEELDATFEVVSTGGGVASLAFDGELRGDFDIEFCE
ncbi:MAG: hypothetical protein GY913_19380 [Proteobacteria bacterium]|nr:hypothetical protein [Pseudomonadota bacterium]MCP4919073.1 hypothetical protein [Pseudomonadota bacterium]